MIEDIVVGLSLVLFFVLAIGSALVPFVQGRDTPAQAEKRWPDEQW